MMVHFGKYVVKYSFWGSYMVGTLHGNPFASEAIPCTVWLQDCWSLFRSCDVSVGKNTSAQSDSASHRVVWGNARWNRRPRLCPGSWRIQLSPSGKRPDHPKSMVAFGSKAFALTVKPKIWKPSNILDHISPNCLIWNVGDPDCNQINQLSGGFNAISVFFENCGKKR